MKRLLTLLMIAMVLGLVTSPILAVPYGGGSGTLEDPYQILTPQQMNTIGLHQEDWNKSFILLADIDMAAYTGTQYNRIGVSEDHPFSGTFDGNRHNIRNLTYTTTERIDYVGLFGRTKNATIQNLGVENVSISSISSFTGGLVGYNVYSTVTGCHATGSVSGTGDIVGGTVGGLVGDNFSGSLTGCYATGSVDGIDFVGGLVGHNEGGTQIAQITACHATGSVSGTFLVGGLVGYNYYGSLITACYATGSVSGIGEDGCGGGLVGFNEWGTLTDCYATGSVSGTYAVGGLVAESYNSTLTACFWDIQTSGQSISSGGEGKTTTEMKTLSTFTNAGWDFVKVWWMPPKDYPHFITLRCETNSFDRLAQGSGASWADCGLGEPRSKDMTPEEDWKAMQKHYWIDRKYGTVGLEDNQGNLLSGQSHVDECGKYVQNQWQIRYKGCVLTSATMIANALLGTDLEPQEVNAWTIFDNTPTLISNEVSWGLVAAAINNDAGVSYYTHAPRVEINSSTKTDPDDIQKIADIICNYNVPVAVRVDDRHTVVAYAVNHDSSEIKILIKDPAGKNYSSLDKYSKVNYIDYIYPCSDCPYRTSSQFTIHSPAEMIITDSLGRKVGFDPRNGQTYSDIPDASYIVDWENDISVGDDPNLYIPGDRNEASKIATIYSLPGETISVEIIGTGDGSGLFTQVNMAPGVTSQLASERSLSLSLGSTETLTVKLPDSGDLDLDGDVDAEDLRRFAGNWMQTAPNLAADIYPPGGDGIVNLYDFAEFAQYWMTP